MPGSISTNDSNGLGYQQGYFSAPVGQAVNQEFFDAAFSGRINENKIYKQAYNCNIVQMCNMSSWLEEFMGYETDCHPSYTLLEESGYRRQVKAKAQATIAAYPSTSTITLSNADHYVGGQYVLPQVGNSIVLAPNGELAEVTAVTTATANDTTITVRLRSKTASAVTVPIDSEMLILEGAMLSDCNCPTGQFKFKDLPVEHDLEMVHFALKGSLCGDALEKCQFLKIPFYDENGNEIPAESPWFTVAQRDMFRDFERRKHYETLLNPIFGLIPVLKARGIKFTPASANAITTDDIRDWKKELDKAGIAGREYAVFAGRNKYSQLQEMLLDAGVVKLDNSVQPLSGCKWIDMEYCGIKVEGMTLHIYDECTFSNGKELGAAGMNFPDSAIFVPMSNRPYDTKRSVEGFGTRNGYSEKMFTRVYFRSVQGRVYDMVVDSNGILNGANGRNTFGTGCKEHEWTVETRFLNEIHCANAWGYIGLE